MKKAIVLAAFLGFCAAVFAAPVRERGRITIELEGNPSTGYSWTYTMEPEGIVRELSAEYRRPSGKEDSAGAGGRAGKGGVFVFVFESVRPGSAGLRFSYVRPWESGVEPAERRDYRLTVNRAGEIRAHRR
ncbi:MAG: protease inhibitor I42 family protein [Treponema sp.]|nr:protease inhibitor I42 family protein [Treponema sp.]